MTCNKDHSGRLGEAARWYSDLQDPDVTLETWEAFLEWERAPLNAAAFQEIERGLVVLDRTTRRRAADRVGKPIGAVQDRLDSWDCSGLGVGDGVGHCGDARPASRTHPIRHISW